MASMQVLRVLPRYPAQAMQVQSATFNAGQVKLGAYGVDPPLLLALPDLNSEAAALDIAV